jgi:hypothetical protein
MDTIEMNWFVKTKNSLMTERLPLQQLRFVPIVGEYSEAVEFSNDFDVN